MILVDANLLLYAAVSSFPQHERARAWLDQRLEGSARVGLPWQSLVAFIRLTTNPRVLRRPMPTALAWARVQSWLERDAAWVPVPTERHGPILAGLLSVPGVHANRVHDAHLAALAIEHGLELCSADRDFARFADLRWSNPLEG